MGGHLTKDKNNCLTLHFFNLILIVLDSHSAPTTVLDSRNHRLHNFWSPLKAIRPFLSNLAAWLDSRPSKCEYCKWQLAVGWGRNFPSFCAPLLSRRRRRGWSNEGSASQWKEWRPPNLLPRHCPAGGGVGDWGKDGNRKTERRENTRWYKRSSDWHQMIWVCYVHNILSIRILGWHQIWHLVVVAKRR